MALSVAYQSASHCGHLVSQLGQFARQSGQICGMRFH